MALGKSSTYVGGASDPALDSHRGCPPRRAPTRSVREALPAAHEAIDRFINVPMSTQVPLYRNRAMTLYLYEAAREKQGRALTLHAAEALISKVKPGDSVIFTTGFHYPAVAKW